MRIVAVLAVLLLSCGALPAAAEDAPPPAPKLNRVDHRQPEAALRPLGEEVGFGQRSESVVRQLQKKAATPQKVLAQILRWVDRNLKPDGEKASSWRGVDQIVKEGTQGGISDRSLVIGTFARAAGIPCVWVKTVSTPWLIGAKQGTASWKDVAGHVFLELHLGGRWRLLDPDTALLYEAYDPATRQLPGNQFAYDKGRDPHALLLPNRGEPWRKQLQAYVDAAPLGDLPWALTRDMLADWRVYVAGSGGPATYASATAKALGFQVEKTFNSGWERVLPEVRGKTLIVVTYDKRPSLPQKYWRRFLPRGYEAILSGQHVLEKGWISHRLPDGTRVIFVTATGYGPVELAVSEALES